MIINFNDGYLNKFRFSTAYDDKPHPSFLKKKLKKKIHYYIQKKLHIFKLQSIIMWCSERKTCYWGWTKSVYFIHLWSTIWVLSCMHTESVHIGTSHYKISYNGPECRADTGWT